MRNQRDQPNVARMFVCFPFVLRISTGGDGEVIGEPKVQYCEHTRNLNLPGLKQNEF